MFTSSLDSALQLACHAHYIRHQLSRSHLRSQPSTPSISIIIISSNTHHGRSQQTTNMARLFALMAPTVATGCKDWREHLRDCVREAQAASTETPFQPRRALRDCLPQADSRFHEARELSPWGLTCRAPEHMSGLEERFVNETLGDSLPMEITKMGRLQFESWLPVFGLPSYPYVNHLARDAQFPVTNIEGATRFMEAGTKNALIQHR